MIFKKIRKIFQENQKKYSRIQTMLKKIQIQNKEIEWANIYHDSIRGKIWLENLSLNIGRWAGNYTFFYILNRVLNDYRPIKILEFGLGESSKLISEYLINELINSEHKIIENNSEWLNHFLSIYKFGERTSIELYELRERNINNFKVNSYKNIDKNIVEKYDLYLVDGPIGSKHFSRFDIVDLISKIEVGDEFIIIIDDYNRPGEKETVDCLINVIKNIGLKIYKGVYEGNKSICVLATEKYRFITSI